jgi:hypothetical protein
MPNPLRATKQPDSVIVSMGGDLSFQPVRRLLGATIDLAFPRRLAILPPSPDIPFPQGGFGMARLRIPTALVALLFATVSLYAQENKAEKLQGTWVHKAKDAKVIIGIKPQVMRCTIVSTLEGLAVTVKADYLVTEDGILLGVVRAEKPGKKADADELEKERIFCCRVAVDKRSLNVSDVKCPSDMLDKVKEMVEGQYQKVESKHPSCCKHFPCQSVIPCPVAVPAPSCPPAANVPAGPASDGPAPLPSLSTPSTEELLGHSEKLRHPSNARPERVKRSSHPNQRMQQLQNQSEDLRQIEQEWAKYWLKDHLSHLTPEQVKPSSDPNQRMQQLMNQSDSSGVIEKQPERKRRKDHPSHLTPDRVNGAIAPN